VLSVAFATGRHGGNRPIIEVLHFIGARTASSQRISAPFPGLGLRAADRRRQRDRHVRFRRGHDPLVSGTASGDQVAALFGTFSLGFSDMRPWRDRSSWPPVTAGTSRHTVNRTLQAID